MPSVIKQTMLVLLLLLEKVAGDNTLTGPSEVMQCAGRSVHVVCQYHPFYRDYVKYWCKGYYFYFCTVLVRTSQSQEVYEDLQISDHKSGWFFTVHMKSVKMADSGWYWCAIERVSQHKSKAVQLIISAEEAQHCSAPSVPPQSIIEATTAPLSSSSTTFSTSTITSSSYTMQLKTKIQWRTSREEIDIVHKIWSITRWVLFIGMCVYLSCFITCFEIWFRRQ